MLKLLRKLVTARRVARDRARRRDGYVYAAPQLLRRETTPEQLSRAIFALYYDAFDEGIEDAIEDAIAGGMQDDRESRAYDA